MKKFASYKYTTSNVFLKSVKYIYGDLFGITFLSNYKIPFEAYNIKVINKNIANKTNLYILADSYIYRTLTPQNFTDVDSILWSNWKDEIQPLYLNKSKKNILIIETSERTFLSKFSHLTKNKYPFIPFLKVETKNNNGNHFPNTKELNENLEFIFLDNPMFLRFKECRAFFNKSLFNRIPETVVINEKEEYLFLRSTVDSNFHMPTEESSFKSINDSLMNECINNYINFYNNYKEIGFDEIYLSIIPNPSTIIGYNNYKYNNLIPRVENILSLKYPCISVFNEFRANKKKVYHRSDSHWTSFGLQIWTDKLNEAIILLNKLRSFDYSISAKL